jgi:hypothetical protein
MSAHLVVHPLTAAAHRNRAEACEAIARVLKHRSPATADGYAAQASAQRGLLEGLAG